MKQNILQRSKKKACQKFCIELSGISCTYGTKRQVTAHKFGSLLKKNKHSLKLSAPAFLWVIRHLGNSTKQIQVHGGHQTQEVAVTAEGPLKCW